MIALHRWGLLYIHPPRTGGTSVTRYLSALSTYRDTEVGGTVLGEAAQPAMHRRFGLTKHASHAELVAVDHALAGYRSLGTWRDPLDRVRSLFGFLRGRDAEAAACADVNEFATSDWFAGDGPDRMFRPLSFWLAGVGTILDTATIGTTLPAWLASAGIPVPPGPVERINGATLDPTPWRPDVERALRDRYAADYALAP